MDIVKELGENQTALLLVPGVEYNDVIVEMAKKLSKKTVCYVTLNKTYTALKKLFEHHGVEMENLVFIDAISSTIKTTPEETEGCYFVSSPAAMTELSLAITKFLKHNFEYLVFDSLTNLLVYSEKTPVAQFVSTLVNKIQESKTKAVFYALNTDKHKELIEECSMFVDDTVDLSSKKKAESEGKKKN